MSKQGNPNPTGSKPDKLIRDALMGAIRQSPDKLKKGAQNLIDRFEAGELEVIKFVTERIDGKAVQPISNDETGEFNVNTSLTVAFVSPKEDSSSHD
jgi:hypothetical protein